NLFKIRIPATSANLGPGFDCFGLALKLYNTFIFDEIPHGFEFIVKFKNKEIPVSQEDNLVYVAMKKTFEMFNKDIPGIRITEEINIPFSRGLGSSATAILAGILASNKILDNPMNNEEILDLAYKIEGHSDNIVPALNGGFNITIIENNKIIFKKISVDESLKIIVVIPEIKIKTKEARKILPTEITREDAIFNLSRASLLTASLITMDYSYLSLAFQDRLHQNYRAKLIPGFYDVVNSAYKEGSLGVALSGSGSSIIAFSNSNEENIAQSMINTFSSFNVNSSYIITTADNNGTIIID
ncbi:MAG TPA: homoserine kinase, partial [Defluviitoga tunisiensis]|nr:homoserine kinase [Defluviitoga tunisiensis]